MFKFRKPTVTTELDILSGSPESVGGDSSRRAECGRNGQGDSVSESRFSVLPRDDDQSEIYSVSTSGSGGSEQEALSQSQPSQSGSSVSGSLQQFQRLPDLNSGNGKTLLDRKRKERHESTSQGQEKKVIRSVSDDESLIDSDKSVDFRRTQSHGSFNPRKDHNLLLGYTIEMRKPIGQDLVELAKRHSENDLPEKLGRNDGNATAPAGNFYVGAEPQFDVMRKIVACENYEAELQRQLERSANWSSAPPAPVKKSHKRRHRSSRRDVTKQSLEIEVNNGDCNEEEMHSPASGSSESVEEMAEEQSNVPIVAIEEAEDVTSQTSDRLMALDFSNAQQKQGQQVIEQKSVAALRAAFGGTSADDEVLLSPRNSVLGKEGIDIPPSPPLHQAPMDPPISRQVYLEGNPVNKMNELARHITALKRHMKQLELEYEHVYGYRPSHSDKLNHKEMRKCVLQLTKTKKELKQIREDPACLQNMSCLSGVSGNILSVNRGNFIPPTKGTPEYVKYLETTVKEIEKTLSDKRRAVNRPDELERMNSAELQEEKCLMQRQLLVLEKRHGRPSSKAEKDIVRPLYERYRAIKRFSVKVVCIRETSIDLAPIMEHEPLEITESPNDTAPRTSVVNEVWASGDRQQLQINTEDDERDERNERYNDMSLGELEGRLKQAKEEKRRMRAAIRKFENDFQNITGRPPQKEEKYSSTEMELAYQKYKRTKATARLLDVLISKRKVPSLITDKGKSEN